VEQVNGQKKKESALIGVSGYDQIKVELLCTIKLQALAFS